MPLEVGFIETVSIRDVWPTENADFTPWLQSHVVELDKVLGLGLSNARSEVGAGSPFRDLAPRADGLQHTQARGAGLLYRVAVNRREARVVVTNAQGRWTAAIDALAERRDEIDRAFAAAGLPRPLEWDGRIAAGRWVIRYAVPADREDEVDPAKMRELNQAAAAMKRAFDPHLRGLDPGLER